MARLRGSYYIAILFGVFTIIYGCKSVQKINTTFNEQLNEAKTNDTLKIRNENRYSAIPKDIFNIRNLRVLHFIGSECDYLPQDCKNITTIPPEINKLSNLEELYLIMNNIKTLPIEINSLKKLRILDLSNNTSINVSNLDNRNIEILNLNECNLTSLPKGIENMNNLKTLGIEGNNIRKEEILRLKTILPNCNIYY
jgi:Leucine-rich repeat (LRR) protein